MCCFSRTDRPVRVETTKIFARPVGERQVLVYSMRLDAPQDVAMILPVPVAKDAGAGGLRFIADVWLGGA